MDKKLNLNKEVIATLNDDSMNRVEGGATAPTNNVFHTTCYSADIMGDSYCICELSNGVVGNSRCIPGCELLY